MLGLAALAIVGAALWLVDERPQATTATQAGSVWAGIVAPSQSPGAPRSAAGGIAPRPVDSAAMPSYWTSPNVDVEELEAAVNRAVEPLDLVFENYQANAELVHWATGDADESARGDALAKCYRMATDLRSECDWGQRVTVKRTGEGTGRVVYVEAAFARDEVESTCARMIACAMAVWEDAVAPAPPGGEDYATLEFLGSPCFLGAGLDARGRDDMIAEMEAVYGEQVKNYEQCDRDACRYNARGLESCLGHLAKMQQYD